MKALKAFSIILFGILASCAVASKKDCAELDWAEKAQMDIIEGKAWQKRLKKYDKVCTKHGFSITKGYMNGVRARGGSICTMFQGFASEGWSGVGRRDAFHTGPPKPEKYSEPCSQFQVEVDLKAYNAGVKFVGAEACSDYSGFNEKGWFGVGERDAKAGFKNLKNSYVQNCKKHYFTNVKVGNFQKGYLAGLKDFCTKSSGYKYGEAGKKYQQTCSKNEQNFLLGYKVGFRVRKANILEQDYRSALSRIKEITSEISEAQTSIDRVNQTMTSDYDRYKREKSSLESDIDSTRRLLSYEEDLDSQERHRSKLEDIREDLIELEDDMRDDERASQRDIEKLRILVSKLREERSNLDRQLPAIEKRYRSARFKADKGLLRLQ